MLPLIVGTLSVTFWAVLVAIPLGLGAAIYLSEFAPARVREVVKPSLEVLAGIPTVIGSGLLPGVLARAWAGDPVGTHFAPHPVGERFFLTRLRFEELPAQAGA